MSEVQRDQLKKVRRTGPGEGTPGHKLYQAKRGERKQQTNRQHGMHRWKQFKQLMGTLHIYKQLQVKNLEFGCLD
jgi:hypothetical protein